ncbi:hypothetical protein [Microbulbifer variabilis]|uniref:hypothetical protein n=1 Tax=Microbulbifer variabilis TaxID=266805 RepID=UPI001CFEFCDF|nr:hypothetical protein [Microbulbifer variabilis]
MLITDEIFSFPAEISQQIRPSAQKLRHTSIFIAAQSMIFGGDNHRALHGVSVQQRSVSLSFRKRALSGILWRKLKS